MKTSQPEKPKSFEDVSSRKALDQRSYQRKTQDKKQVGIEDKNRIRFITLQRPEKKNALTQAMYLELTEALVETEQNADLRVAVITGSEDSFTSGNDLHDFMNNPPDINRPGETPVEGFLQQLAQSQKPLLAAVNGLGIGIGLTLLLHCDCVYASENAVFSAPFVDLGLCPEAASSQLLPQRIGTLRAQELLFLGEIISAQKAREWGLVNEVFPQNQLIEKTRERAEKLAKKSPSALKITKALLKRPYESIEKRISQEGKHFAEQLKSEEFFEAVQAFLEKRSPDFSRF